MTQDAHQGMEDCRNMDMEQPALCHAHATNQAEKQSLDKPELPGAAPFLNAALFLVVTPLDLALHVQAAPRSMQVPLAVPLPISIRNCCFRI
ncbi:MAG TPA: hypothetical protein VIF60_02705 [Burkholderiaceae bacterium]